MLTRSFAHSQVKNYQYKLKIIKTSYDVIFSGQNLTFDTANFYRCTEVPGIGSRLYKLLLLVCSPSISDLIATIVTLLSSTNLLQEKTGKFESP